MDKRIMSTDTSDIVMEHVEEGDSSGTLSQLEMDAVEVLMEFTPSVQPQDNTVLQWSGKRKRSHRLSSSDPTILTEGKGFHRAFEYAFDEGKFFVARKHALINTEGADANARAKSPNSPLPMVQMECGTFDLGGWAIPGAPQKVHRVAIEANTMLCKPASPSNAEESEMQTSNINLDNAKSRDAVESNPSMQQTSEARLQAGAQAISKSNEFLFEGGGDAYRLLRVPEVKESEKPIIMRNQVLCKQLLKLAVRLAWEIKSLRHKKSMLMEEVHLLKNQTFCLKQQHPSITEAIQTTDVSKSQGASSLLLAGDQCAVLQNHPVMREGDGGAGGLTVSIAGNSKHHSNASVSTTPSSISSTSQNSTECNAKDPKYISRTLPQKDMNILEAQTEPIVEQNMGPTTGDASMQSTGTKNTGFTFALCQAGRHAALSSSNKHGFIDVHGTWVIAPESLDDCVDDVHVHDTHKCKGGVLTQAKTPNLGVDDTPTQLTVPHHYMNHCVNGVPAQLIVSPQSFNRCVDGASSHPKAPPQSLNHCVDGISIQCTHSLQSVNPHVGNGSIQFPCPLQILNNGAVAQLAWPSSPYEASPQAIILLYDKKFTFTEARRRRKEMNRIKRQQSKVSRLH